MRMAINHFLADALYHIPHRKAALLRLDFRMKDHLHQHIPQLLTEIFHILFVNRIRRLVSLLQHIHADGCMRLHPVPRTAVFAAQNTDNPHQIL